MDSGKIKYYLEIMNLDRTQAAVSSVLLGFALGLRAFPDFIISALPLVVSTILIYCTGAILNNVSDAVFDGKKNPVFAGIVRKRNAFGLAAALAFIGMFIASLYGLFALGVGALMVAAGIFYSYFFRIKDKVWCTLFLAFTHHLGPLVLGYYAVRQVIDSEILLFAISIYVPIAGIILVKDFKDVERDIAEGRRNIAILLGLRKASRIVLLSSLLYVVLVFGLAGITGVTMGFMTLLVVASALGIAALSILLAKTPSIETGRALMPNYRQFISMNLAFWSLALVL